MRKLLCALLAVCLLMPVLGTAMAASLPTVSFSAQSGVINGGCDYQLTIRVSSAQTSNEPMRPGPCVTATP